MTTTGIILLCIAAVLIAVLLAFFIVLKIRARRFRPTGDKAAQQEALNRDIGEAGFAYDRKGDVFYSLMDCWQREMGYCQLYDEGSSPVQHGDALRARPLLLRGKTLDDRAVEGAVRDHHRSGGGDLQYRSG